MIILKDPDGIPPRRASDGSEWVHVDDVWYLARFAFWAGVVLGMTGTGAVIWAYRFLS